MSAVRIDGVLTTKQIKGAYGVFTVGYLKTSIGQFRVKDSVLDQFDEGSYKGVFWISHIGPTSYTTSDGRTVTEVKATLADLSIFDGKTGIQEDTSTEPDPIVEVKGTTPVAADKENPTTETAKPVGQPSDSDGELFGEETYQLVQARQPVKLDPAMVDRQVFRQQRDRLKALGYAFNAKNQTWFIHGKGEAEQVLAQA